MEYQYLTQESINQFIRAALAEDVGSGDHSSLGSIPADAKSKAHLLVKAEGILAGVEMAQAIFSFVDPNLKVQVFLNDGQPITFGDIVLIVEGSARSILTAERLVLNCMQRMSGIATHTHEMATLLADFPTKILDTRKTTPNFRLPEKWAVKIGGGTNHRFGLFDQVMLKDNHADFAGGITAAIKSVKSYLLQLGKDLPIVVETRNLKEVQEVLAIGGIYRIMLDNMSLETMRQAVELINGRYLTEASGGITKENIRDVAACGVDFISVGALTHSTKSLDLSLKAIQ